MSWRSLARQLQSQLCQCHMTITLWRVVISTCNSLRYIIWNCLISSLEHISALSGVSHLAYTSNLTSTVSGEVTQLNCIRTQKYNRAAVTSILIVAALRKTLVWGVYPHRICTADLCVGSVDNSKVVCLLCLCMLITTDPFNNVHCACVTYSLTVKK